MTRTLLTISSIFIISVSGLTLPTLAQNAPNCAMQEEIFTFDLSTYATAHQGGAILNIKVAYRLTNEAVAKQDYPDFVPIRKDIDNYLVNYHAENDYWEIVNRKLVQFILDKYPQMSSLRVEMDVMPTPKWPFRRSSIVQSTRPQSCQISTY
jgi:hypothetical protein